MEKYIIKPTEFKKIRTSITLSEDILLFLKDNQVNLSGLCNDLIRKYIEDTVKEQFEKYKQSNFE